MFKKRGGLIGKKRDFYDDVFKIKSFVRGRKLG